MKLCALISWYDEDPDALEAIVRDARRCGVTHLFALDGAYAAYPGGQASSDPEQAERIEQACSELGITHSVEAPAEVWAGGEVEKRNSLFEWAADDFQLTPRDWFLVLDADERIEHAQNLGPLLARCDRTGRQDVWDVLVIEQDVQQFGVIRNRWNRRAFRCLPGLHVHPRSHWHYLDGDGRILWGYNAIPAAGHLPILIRNRSTTRTAERAHGREAYYAKRNTERLENYEPDHCARCTEPWTSRINIVRLEQLPTGTVDLTMKRTLFVCDDHFASVKASNEVCIQKALAELPRHVQKQMVHTLLAARKPSDQASYVERLAVAHR